MVRVIVCLPSSTEGATKIINWTKSDDGFTVTKTHKGFQYIEALLSEDGKTVWLYEKWASKEDHQAYLGWRMENGMGDFMEEVLTGEFTLHYLDRVDD